MIEENYVSFETAKLLKEKGFDEKCMSYYGHGEFHLGHPKYMKSNTDRDGVAFNGVPYDAYNAPTLQMAMEWLREKYNIHIEPRYFPMPNIYRYVIIHSPATFENIDSHPQYFNTHEEACEAAIKYCLENLI